MSRHAVFPHHLHSEGAKNLLEVPEAGGLPPSRLCNSLKRVINYPIPVFYYPLEPWKTSQDALLDAISFILDGTSPHYLYNSEADFLSRL